MPDVMATARVTVRCRCDASGARAARGAFTLVDVLVSLVVIGVLISVLLPSLALVRETTRRVICSSNVRQIGLGLAMYAEDYRGALPVTRFIPEMKSSDNTMRVDVSQPQDVMMARVLDPDPEWDGLGHLFENDYLTQFGVFYCPSHHGQHPLSRYARMWSNNIIELTINYQYRGQNITRSDNRVAVVSDGLRTRSDYNHMIGANVLRLDFSVGWFNDPSGRLIAQLPDEEGDIGAASKVLNAWNILDFSTDR